MHMNNFEHCAFCDERKIYPIIADLVGGSEGWGRLLFVAKTFCGPWSYVYSIKIENLIFWPQKHTHTCTQARMFSHPHTHTCLKKRKFLFNHIWSRNAQVVLYDYPATNIFESYMPFKLWQEILSLTFHGFGFFLLSFSSLSHLVTARLSHRLVGLW